MKISLGSDHAGFRYKEKVKELLGTLGYEVKDFGTFSEEPVDYPLFIRPAAEAVARGECDRGIVFGGSGNGEAMVAILGEFREAKIIILTTYASDVQGARNPGARACLP